VRYGSGRGIRESRSSRSTRRQVASTSAGASQPAQFVAQRTPQILPAAARSTSSRPARGVRRASPQHRRSLGSGEKHTPWSQPWISSLRSRQQVPALPIGVVDHRVRSRDRRSRASRVRISSSTSIESSTSITAAPCPRPAGPCEDRRGRPQAHRFRTRARRSPRASPASGSGSRPAAARRESACRSRGEVAHSRGVPRDAGLAEERRWLLGFRDAPHDLESAPCSARSASAVEIRTSDAPVSIEDSPDSGSASAITATAAVSSSPVARGQRWPSG